MEPGEESFSISNINIKKVL